MSLSVDEVSSRPSDVGGQPLHVCEWHHGVQAALPQGDWDADLAQVEPPRSGVGQVVVAPPHDALTAGRIDRGGEVLGELPGQRGAVHRRCQSTQSLRDLLGGDGEESLPDIQERLQLLDTSEDRRVFRDVLLGHAVTDVTVVLGGRSDADAAGGRQAPVR